VDLDRLAVAGGVLLRAPRPDDRERWFELRVDRDERRYGVPAFVPEPSGPADLDETFAQAREHLAAGEPANLVAAAVDDPDRLLGNVAWRATGHRELRIADIGYAVHPDARGRGVGRRAIVALATWLMHDDAGPGMARVQLDHSVENLASCRVALAAGFEQEGIRRGFLPLRDAEPPFAVRRHDVCLHGSIVSDPLPAAGPLPPLG
jgi:RimJ/RimL family protein N-acetyltransferase